MGLNRLLLHLLEAKADAREFLIARASAENMVLLVMSTRSRMMRSSCSERGHGRNFRSV